MGGDEFAVLLPGTSPEQADELAARLGDSIAARVGDLGVGASVGVASFPEVSAEHLLSEADHRLYDSKREHAAARITSARASAAVHVLPEGRTATG